jgi:hypothetical protein
MNVVDADRLSSKTAGGVVVDLAAYRASAGSPDKAAKPYASPQLFTLALFIFAALGVLALIRR